MADLPKKYWYTAGVEGGRNFVYSHIKAIYYNWSQKKLLSEKLDEMDASILESVTKSMMSGVDTESADHVPTSEFIHSLVERIVKNEAAITALNNAFNYDEQSIIAVHNNTPRGKVLTDGTNLTNILANVAKGDFSDIFVGDIIKAQTPAITETGSAAGEKSYVVIGINSLKNYGDGTPPLQSKNHLVMIPLDGLGDAKMNDTNDTTGGYKSSKMNTTVIPAVVTALQTAFGTEHVLKTRELISNAVNKDATSAGYSAWKGASSGWEWSDQYAILLSELECYGAQVWSSSAHDNGGYDLQFPGMKIDWVMNRRFSRWLRGVASSSNFCGVASGGNPDANTASNVRRVAPRFVIG